MKVWIHVTVVSQFPNSSHSWGLRTPTHATTEGLGRLGISTWSLTAAGLLANESQGLDHLSALLLLHRQYNAMKRVRTRRETKRMKKYRQRVLCCRTRGRCLKEGD